MEQTNRPNFLLFRKLHQRLLYFLQHTYISKDKVPLKNVLTILWNKLITQNIHQQASAIAFSFTLSLFPSIIFLFTLLPFIPIPDLKLQVTQILESTMPAGLYDFVADTVLDILHTPRVDLLSLGFILALYSATSGVSDLMETFNQNYPFAKPRNFINKRLIAIFIAFIFAFLLIFAVTVIIIGNFVIDFISHIKLIESNWLYYAVVLLRYLIVFGVFTIGVAYIYRVAPAVHNHWSFFSIGAVFASVSAIIVTNGFSFYLSKFANYNKFYGSIGTFIALMFWLYILGWVLILGFEINASIYEAKQQYRENNNTKN
ncbi:MAG: YihY/virulence factor BrkB family protein [Microscillaceae bacterium]|nr:YihY/virulence factor BrkB family protein [Microscillaceae bacterium]MDW8460145.1 YihY/virulence factor BrkB family protein [Cytophagales bacterium]